LAQRLVISVFWPTLASSCHHGLYRRSGREALPDLCQHGGEVFSNPAIAPSAWAWWRGRADSLRRPGARNSRLGVCGLSVTSNVLCSHVTRSGRQIGPPAHHPVQGQFGTGQHDPGQRLALR